MSVLYEMSEREAAIITRQKVRLPITNFDDEEVKKNSMLLPEALRAIICGPSGCGKTNIMLSLLFEPNGLKFKNIYVYSKSLYQPKYKLLSDVVARVRGMGYFPFSENEEVIDPSEALEDSVFIFDDVACEKQDKIRAYFCMSRHKRISSLLANQSYAAVPKHLIRDNANVLVLFKQDEMNLKHVYDDHVTTDMTFEAFKGICRLCWETNHGVLVIVKEKELFDGRYRRGFDEFISVGGTR